MSLSSRILWRVSGWWVALGALGKRWRMLWYCAKVLRAGLLLGMVFSAVVEMLGHDSMAYGAWGFVGVGNFLDDLWRM